MTEKALKPIKPFLNYEEQINNLIEQKGMIVNDHKFAVEANFFAYSLLLFSVIQIMS